MIDLVDDPDGSGGDPVVCEELTLRERLEQTPTGPQLAGLLAAVDRGGLEPGELVWVAVARQRLVAHQEAQLLADLHAIARADPDGPREADTRYPWAEVETACALRWTHHRAGAQLELAEQVIDRLPALYEALDAGLIDVPKVRVVTDLLGCVDDELAAAVVDKVVDQAARLTTGQLRARLRRLLMAVDPQLVARRSREGIGQRRVVAYPDPDSHLATLSGCELAPQRVAAVMERLDAIAKASKAAGDQRSMDQIRADAFLDLLCGQGVALGGAVSDGAAGCGDPAADLPGAADGAVDVAGEQPPWPTEPPEPDPPEPDPLDLDRPDPVEPDPELAGVDVAGVDVAGVDVAGVDPEAPVNLWPAGLGWPPPTEDLDPDPADPDADTDTGVAQRRRWLAGFDRLPTTRPATRCVLCGHLEGEPPSPGPLPAPRAGVVEITATLDTLAGLAALPAELAGYGPVAADIARQVAAEMPQATWRYSIYDPMRQLAFHGTTRARPAPDPRPDSGPDLGGGHHTSRRPSPAQAARIKARDRTCVAPGCRRAARRCEIDHTLDWVKGGETIDCNLCLLCKRHHMFKHASGACLLQLTPGVFTWRTPAGMHYLTRSDYPLIDVNELAGLPKPGTPPHPDLHLLNTTIGHTTPIPEHQPT